MWNKMQPQGGAPGGMPPRAPAPGPAAPGGPPPMPPQAGPPMPPGMPPGGGDPGAGGMMARIQSLSPQEAQMFIEGINEAAIAVLKKVVPELAPILDSIVQKHGGGDGPGGDLMGGAPPAQAPAPPQSRLAAL